MKKIFSFLTAILFAGSMWAKDVTSTMDLDSQSGTISTTTTSFTGTQSATWTLSYDANTASVNSDSGDKYFQIGSGSKTATSMTWTSSSFSGKKVRQVKVKGSTSGTSASVSVVSGSVTFTATTSAYTSSTATTLTFNSPTTGGDILSNDLVVTIAFGSATKKNIRLFQIDVIYVEDDDTPAISADNINFGSREIAAEAENFELDTTLVVIGANLSAAIVPAGSTHVTITESELPAVGGTLHLHIVAPKGNFSEKITLTSGETVKEVTVSGTVTKPIVVPGTAATMTAGTKASAAKVNGEDAIKVGNSDNDGDMTISVAANTTKLHFFAAAWNGAAGTIALSASDENVKLDTASVTLVANSGISGNSPFTLSGEITEDYYFTITLTGVTAATDITLASDGARRFVVWGAKYETQGTPTAIDNTEAGVKAVKVLREGQIFILRGEKVYTVQGQLVK